MLFERSKDLMRCTLAYEIKSTALKMSSASRSHFPVQTYFGNDRLIFTYVMEKQIKTKKSEIMLNRLNVEKVGTNYVIEAKEEPFKKYLELGFLFAVESAVLEVQYFKGGLLHQQILFRREDSAGLSEILMKMARFDYSEIHIVSFGSYESVPDAFPDICSEHDMKHYRIVLPSCFDGSKTSFPDGLKAMLKYPSIDGVSKISIYPELNSNIEDPAHFSGIFTEYMRKCQTLRELNISLMENKIPVMKTVFTNSLGELNMDFMVPAEFTGKLNRTLLPFVEKEDGNEITIVVIDSAIC